MEHYKTIMDESGSAIVMEELHSSVNIYVTKAQLRRQELSLMSKRSKDRWHGGSTAAVYENQELSEELLDQCTDDDMTAVVERIGRIDDTFGVTYYEMKPKFGHTYVVAGDSGKSNLIRMSSQNVPCVMVFDITDFLKRPIELVALYWFDGNGSYKGFINTMQGAMLRYSAAGYYDATNVQTAFEDIRGGGFDGWPTTPVFFSGTIGPKRWALTIIVTLLADKMFKIPYIKGLWHQARVYDISSRRVPDDIIATLMVFGLAMRVEDTLWTQLEGRYRWKRETGEESEYEDLSSYDTEELVETDRYERVSGF